MKRILIFSGTTEGRQLADILDASGICADVCVATEYGHEVMTEGQYRNIYTGRLTEEEMKEFMQKEKLINDVIVKGSFSDAFIESPTDFTILDYETFELEISFHNYL